jgi:hypothetical protein
MKVMDAMMSYKRTYLVVTMLMGMMADLVYQANTASQGITHPMQSHDDRHE